MRHGSTLVPSLQPDAQGMMTEQILTMPEGSFWHTIVRMIALVAITFGFIFVFERFWLLLVFMLFSARYGRTTGKSLEVPATDLLVTFAVHRSLLPFVFCPISFALVVYQAVKFTRHWVYLLTAGPCAPEVTHQIRANLETSLPLSVILLPISLLRGVFYLAADPGQALDAWVSYLNYGKGDRRAAGVFRSLAGGHMSRVRLFYTTGAAMSLSILNTPMPFLSGPIDPAIFWLVGVFVPPSICVLVPSLLLAANLGTLRRMCDEA